MPPGIDEGINAEIELATVGDRTTPFRKLLVDGTERTAKKWKRDFVRAKRTDEGTENQFFLNVVQTMLRILESGRIVANCVFWTRRFREI